jgi:predicted DCC family thiol-disulfide oxidoreductase YuxK
MKMQYYLLLLCTILSPLSNALLSSTTPVVRFVRSCQQLPAAVNESSRRHSSSSTNTDVHQKPLFPEKLNIIYDSKCSVCQWEVDYLKQRIKDLAIHNNNNNSGGNNSNSLIRFTDLESSEGYNESDPANGGVTYTMGMTSFHAVKPNGELLHGVPVFVEAYDIVDQGWIWEMTKWPIVGNVASWGYDMFAKVRTQLTRGSSVERLIEEHYTRRDEMMMMTKKNDDGGGGGEVCEPCQSKIASEK